MLAKTISGSIIGIHGMMVQVEVDLQRGLPSFDIVGLPDKAVRESRERVKSAIKNSGFEFPITKITINLAPADIKKNGSFFDLAIATGILAASEQLNTNLLNRYMITGELSLSGEVKKIKGLLPMVIEAKKKNMYGVIVPYKNLQEIKLISNIKIIPVKHLREVISFFNKKIINKEYFNKTKNIKKKAVYKIDFSDVKGQEDAKRALEIATAGLHNIIMIGPPGSGKTMLAKRIRTILPPLTKKESLELTSIYSILGITNNLHNLIRERPFRSPHHNISTAGLIGGGKIPEPGEVSLAHHGILFLDELPEFNRNVLELLRQPLESSIIKISRALMSITFPANFMLIAAMNPCPCGYYGDEHHQCTCSLTQIKKYRAKVSGPLLDRIDIHIEVPALNASEITGENKGESSAEIRKRVIKVHKIQLKRYEKLDFNYNSQLFASHIEKYCQIENKEKEFLKTAIEELGLSVRGYDRILRLSRTIADLDNSDKIKINHLAEAIQFRNLDRKLF